jgi:hypothetical protein
VRGEWLRGNLHCHTANSDGRLSPQQTVDWFAANGYQFLALTDHNTVTDPAALDAKGMCLLTSAEVTATGGEFGGSYHLITLGLPADAMLPATATPVEESVMALRAQGGLVFVAHPHWSRLTVGDITRLSDIAGIEIYNGGTVLDSHKGEALIHWDEGLARGCNWFGIAVDDTHWHTIDRGLGWVMARAPERTPGTILRALAVGQFYASAGPEIRDVTVTPEGDGLRFEVETSPCAIIYALPYGERNQYAADNQAIAREELGATITRASFVVKRPDSATRAALRVRPFVRIQCTDWERRSAWSNAFFL